MKKIIFVLIFAMAGLLFAGMQSVNAQVDYTVHIAWNDNNCNCDTVTIKKCRVVLVDLVTSITLDDSEWYTVSGTTDIYNSSADIIYDAEDRYRLTIAVVYYNDENKVCCSGSDSVVYDGDDFLLPIPFPTIFMN